MSAGRLLVTGGCGFIGSTLVRNLVARDMTVTVVDALTYAGRVEHLKEIAKDPHLTIIIGDITDAHMLRELFSSHSFTAVINLAAETHVDRSIIDASPFITTNVLGTQQLLNSARQYWETLSGESKKGFRFIQVSTDEVFGSLGDEGRFSEESPYAPRSPYAASKAAADHLVAAAFHTFGLPVITTYCGNNYGPRQYQEKLIPLTIKRALAGKPIPVYGDGKNIRDWVHVEDHANGLIAALDRGVPGSRYCFGSGNELTNLEVLDLVCAALETIRPSQGETKYRALATFVEDRLGHDRRYALDATKARRELGFAPTHTFEASIADVVRSYVESGS